MAPLLEAALAHRLISKKQYRNILEELEVSPRADVGALLLDKHYLTAPQLEQLRELTGDAGPEPSPENASDFDLPQTDEAAAPSSPVADIHSRITPRPIATSTPLPVSPQGPSQSTPPALSSKPAPATSARVSKADIPITESDDRPEPIKGSGKLGPRQPRKKLKELLQLARHWGCSDLHVSVGRPPFVRMNGEIRYMEMDPLTPEDAAKLNFQLLNDDQREILVEKLNLDFPLQIPEVGRHRCNVFHQRLGWDGVYRIVPNEVPTFEKLGLPPVVRTLTEFHQGMVLVTGPARSGKTTTMAAMVDLVNSTREDHVITIEDPIEYVHAPKRCQMTQREIGPHSKSFGMALRAALREDPDIVMIGELRDHETISISISAAETGHLVFGSLHTGSAARTVNRILDVYPAQQRSQISLMISESIRGILSQQLIPRVDKQGMALALEVLLVNSGVSALIRDARTHQFTSVMQSGKRQGMQTMDDALLELVKSGTISGDDAWFAAENKQVFDSMRSQQKQPGLV